jgi:hypothetical protein
LASYHSQLSAQINSILTERLTAEVLDVIADPSKVDTVNRTLVWSDDDKARLNRLNEQARNLQTPPEWTWSAKEGTDQFEYNHRRLKYFVEHELETVIKHCDRCKCTSILVGVDQIDSAYCYDCVTDRRRGKAAKEFEEDWKSVRPPSLDYHGLPELFPGDKVRIWLH